MKRVNVVYAIFVVSLCIFAICPYLSSNTREFSLYQLPLTGPPLVITAILKNILNITILPNENRPLFVAVLLLASLSYYSLLMLPLNFILVAGNGRLPSFRENIKLYYMQLILLLLHLFVGAIMILLMFIYHG